MKKVLAVILLLVGVVGILFAGLVVAGGGMSPVEYQEALWELKQIPDEQFKLLVANKNQATEEKRLEKEVTEKKRQITEEELKLTNVLSEEDYLLGIGTVFNPLFQLPEGATDDKMLALVELQPRQLTTVITKHISKKGDMVIVFKKKNGGHGYMIPL